MIGPSLVQVSQVIPAPKPMPMRPPSAPFIEPSAPITSPIPYAKAPAQLVPSPPPNAVQPEPLAGPNVMKVVLVGAECAPWSKTGKSALGELWVRQSEDSEII